MKSYLSALLWTQGAALVVLTGFVYPLGADRLVILWGGVAGAFFLLVPGYRFSFLFFADNEVESVERGVMSAALSVGIFLLFVFYLKYLFIALYPIHIYVLSILLITGCAVVMGLRSITWDGVWENIAEEWED